MNLCALLLVPLPKALQIITRENDKTRVCSTYVEEMDLNVENSKISKWKVHFNDIWRSIRHNPCLHLQEPHPDAHSDTKSTRSNKKMDIIGENPNRFVPNVDQSKF